MIDSEKLTFASSILKTIAHPLRLGIVDLLIQHEELSVNEICRLLDAEQSLVSHHLTSMRQKGVLSCNRQGKSMHYVLLLKELEKVIECMETCKINRA
jgi:ArsR family transcriptional regulator